MSEVEQQTQPLVESSKFLNQNCLAQQQIHYPNFQAETMQLSAIQLVQTKNYIDNQPLVKQTNLILDQFNLTELSLEQLFNDYKLLSKQAVEQSQYIEQLQRDLKTKDELIKSFKFQKRDYGSMTDVVNKKMEQLIVQSLVDSKRSQQYQDYQNSNQIQQNNSQICRDLASLKQKFEKQGLQLKLAWEEITQQNQLIFALRNEVSSLSSKLTRCTPEYLIKEKNELKFQIEQLTRQLQELNVHMEQKEAENMNLRSDIDDIKQDRQVLIIEKEEDQQTIYSLINDQQKILQELQVFKKSSGQSVICLKTGQIQQEEQHETENEVQNSFSSLTQKYITEIKKSQHAQE